MPNAPLIIETALLLLVAFLIGCVAGYALRRLLAGKPRSTSAQATAAPAAPAPVAGEQLVVAPTIAPIASTAATSRRTAAQRLAAAAPEPEIEAEQQSAPLAAKPDDVASQPAAEVDSQTIEPARVAGETTSGRRIPAPVEQPAAPDVEPEEPAAPVVAAEVPEIDEALNVLDPDRAAPPAETEAASAPAETAAAPEPEPAATAPTGIAWSELSGRPEEDLRSRLEAESEQAAMRAIEGGWTPRAARRSQPVELPEPIREIAPDAAGTPEPAAAEVSDTEVAGALSAVRTAVAAASAAADAALAEHAAPANEAPEPEPEPEAAAAGEPPGEAHPHAPFGRPAGLAAPREGGKDDLRRIKGITPQAEAALNALGIFHFDQIAAWDKKSALWIDNHLALKGGLVREKWIEQARDLAKARVPGLRAAGKR